MDKYTSWTEATKSPYVALAGLISCLNHGYNAWIEKQENGKQDFPVKVKNPDLDIHFNWDMSYGIPFNQETIDNYKFFNETEKDLTINYTSCYADEKSADIYTKTGKPTKGLLKGYGIGIPVKISDAESLRTDGYKYGYWMYFWKAKDNIPYWIPADIGDVYVVCYNHEPVNIRESLINASDFLRNIAIEL